MKPFTYEDFKQQSRHHKCNNPLITLYPTCYYIVFTWYGFCYVLYPRLFGDHSFLHLYLFSRYRSFF